MYLLIIIYNLLLFFFLNLFLYERKKIKEMFTRWSILCCYLLWPRPNAPRVRVDPLGNNFLPQDGRVGMDDFARSTGRLMPNLRGPSQPPSALGLLRSQRFYWTVEDKLCRKEQCERAAEAEVVRANRLGVRFIINCTKWRTREKLSVLNDSVYLAFKTWIVKN